MKGMDIYRFEEGVRNREGRRKKYIEREERGRYTVEVPKKKFFFKKFWRTSISFGNC